MTGITMNTFEYKIIPAPKKGLKAKGIKGAEAQFANALMAVMNEMGADGWEYQRSDSLPLEVRSGFRGRSTTFQYMLVFRREIIAAPVEMAQPEVMTQEFIPEEAPYAAPVMAEPTTPPLSGAAPTYTSAAPELGPAIQRPDAQPQAPRPPHPQVT